MERFVCARVLLTLDSCVTGCQLWSSAVGDAGN